MCYKAFRHKTTRAILSKKVCFHYRDTICLCGAGRPVRQDPVASPQDGTPTKQASDKTRPQNRCGSLWARMHRQDNETPALNALKALRGAPISMGRGEIPVELRPAAVRFLPLLWF